MSIQNIKKYQEYQGNIELVMSEEERNQAFERFSKRLQKKREEQKYDGKRHILRIACAAAICIAVGGSVISGAVSRGMLGKYLKTTFSKAPGEEVVTKKQVDKGEDFQVSLSSYYLDELGYGEFLFEVSDRDGNPLRGTVTGNDFEVGYRRTGEKNASIEKSTFTEYGESCWYASEEEDGKTHYGNVPGGDKEFAGYTYEIEGNHIFDPLKHEIVLQFRGQDYVFDHLQYTSKIYQWKVKQGEIRLSEIGMILPGSSELAVYLSKKVEETGKIGTVYYKDGHTEDIKIESFSGNAPGRTDNRETVVRFSPVSMLDVTDWDEGYINGLKEEEFSNLFDYHTSVYFFSLKDVEKLKFGKIVLETSEARVMD